MAKNADVNEAWDRMKVALETHAKLGRKLQRQGLALLTEGGNVVDVQRLVGSGVEIERKALEGVFRLERNKPR